MKKLFYLTFALLAWTACGTSSTKDNDPWGQIDPGDANKQSIVVESAINSSVLKQSMSYSVWLPAGYDKTKTYPFLYLLHGYEYGDQSRLDRCWLDKGNAAKIADDYQKANGVPMAIAGRYFEPFSCIPERNESGSGRSGCAAIRYPAPPSAAVSRRSNASKSPNRFLEKSTPGISSTCSDSASSIAPLVNVELVMTIARSHP